MHDSQMVAEQHEQHAAHCAQACDALRAAVVGARREVRTDGDGGEREREARGARGESAVCGRLATRAHGEERERERRHAAQRAQQSADRRGACEQRDAMSMKHTN